MFPLKVKADWRKLIMANYVIDPALVLPYVPKGTTLDFWEDECYVSLVGFMFDKSKLNSIPIPFHQSFEEVNLRFYVKRKEGDLIKRGVVFIREFVPKAAVTMVANGFFREHYETIPMKHTWEIKENEQHIQYAWKKNVWHSIDIITDVQAQPLTPGSKEDFFTEHYWGYTSFKDRTTLEYFVDHHPWEVYATQSYSVEVDFEMCYGKMFGFLGNQKPTSVFLAEGSQISLQKNQQL
jgi:uncharacterized protein YqjF (DUF2071 family)